MNPNIREALADVLEEQSSAALNGAEYGNAAAECRVTFKDGSQYLVRVTIDKIESTAVEVKVK